MHARGPIATLVALATGSIIGCAGAKPSDLLTQTDAIETVPSVENNPVTGLEDPPQTTSPESPIIPVPPTTDEPDGGKPTGRTMIAIYDYVRTRDGKDHFFTSDPAKALDGYTRPTRPAFYVLPMAGADNATLRQCDAIGGDLLREPHYLTIGTCDLGNSGTTLGAVATKANTIPGCNDVSIDLNSNQKKAWGFSATSYDQGKCK